MQLGPCGLALLAAGLVASRHEAFQERSPGVRRTVYVLEVDLARARAIGWASQDASDAQVVTSAGRIVQRRLEAMERSFHLEPDLEKHRLELAMPQIQPRDRELFEDMLKSLGSCEFLYVADDELTKTLDLDLAAERKKLETWRAGAPDSPVETFHALDAAHQGPHRLLLWVETDFPGTPGSPLAVLLPDKPEDHIGSGSFARASPQDHFGFPAIAFELSKSRVDDFSRLTEAHLDHRLAIVLDGKVRSAPTLNSKLTDRGVIEGRFTAEEVERLAEAFTKPQGPLRVVEVR